MHKILITHAYVFLCMALTCCSLDEGKSEVKDLDVDVYMAKRSKIDKRHLIDSVESDINQAFGLLPLESSTSQHEVRIYYLSVWFERFLRQRYDSGKLVSELYNCKTNTINDSIFMSIGTRITDSRSYPLVSFFNTQALPVYKFAQSNYEGVLDAGSLHFIQIKEPGSKKKRIYIDDPFDLETNDLEVKAICNYLRSLKRNFGFNLFDSWDDIKKKAFLNN